MTNLVNTQCAVSVRDAQKNGNLIHIEPNEVKNLKAGNRYELNGKELFIKSSYNSKKRAGSHTGYTVIWDGQEFTCKDITELQKRVTGQTAREAGYSQKRGDNIPVNGYVPTNRDDARQKARAWTATAAAKVAEAGKMFTLTESEQEVLKRIAIRYYRSKVSDLLQRYETKKAEDAQRAEEKKLKTVDGQRERADRAEAELARAKAMLAELGVTL